MNVRLIVSVLGGFVGLLSSLESAQAQVIPDGTVGTIVTGSPNFTINGGTRPSGGPNLFHSFSQFSVPTGGAAIFNNAPDVVNILSRITGGTLSSIDGRIQANGAANLFLINPAGIIFGPNARLSIGGSFIGSTATSLKFADNTEFSATNPTASPLLTINVPIGLQMGANPGSIAVNGSTLQVPAGKTLALIGGAITQTGGRLQVSGKNGRIELTSLGSQSQARLTPATGGWAITPLNPASFQDITIKKSATISGNGDGGAAITINARNFTLSGSDTGATATSSTSPSVISNNNTVSSGSLNAQPIIINATDSLIVQEAAAIRGQTLSSGKASDIRLNASTILFNNNASILSLGQTGSTGNAGSVSLQGNSITISNTNPLISSSNISNIAASQGNAGNISLQADTITLSNRGGISNTTRGKGNAGNVILKANSLTFDNGGGVNNTTTGEGNGGNTNFISKTFIIRNGSGGNVGSSGTGNAGDLNIIADTFYLEQNSGYSSRSLNVLGGKAGNINVTADKMIARDNSGLSSDTFNANQGGNISLNVGYIELDDTQLNSRSTGSGNAGQINVTAQTLRLLNGGQLNVSTRAAGQGGDILVNAQMVELNGASTQKTTLATKNTGIISSILSNSTNSLAVTGSGGNIAIKSGQLIVQEGAIVSSSASAGSGNGGNIAIQVGQLNVLNGGQIMNVTRSAGNAGTTTIQASDRVLVSGFDPRHAERQAAYIPNQTYSDVDYNISALSGIFANATETATGNGGNLQLTARSIEINQGEISVGSFGSGSGGNITVNSDYLSLKNQAALTAETASTQGGNITLNLQDSLMLRYNSLISATAGTAQAGGNGGNININLPQGFIFGILTENSDIRANAFTGNGGKIDITAQGIFGLQLQPRNTSKSDITASSQFGFGGIVQINDFTADPISGLVQLPNTVSDASQNIATGCSTTQGSQFIMTGRGGLAQNPNQEIMRDLPWHDLRDVSAYRGRPASVAQDSATPMPLLQASGFHHNPDGTIELIASPVPVNPPSIATCSGQSMKTAHAL
ncbi:filamentous hemagglutinin N-terminal domain-containing protein [Alkalinema pantanalense CENA528]|uniref:two-partner secretion domain-containing protein n=1 Tax=Alkalinema pantanalense TaxID=1620705 RepID=UPI003D6F8F2C